MIGVLVDLDEVCVFGWCWLGVVLGLVWGDIYTVYRIEIGGCLFFYDTKEDEVIKAMDEKYSWNCWSSRYLSVICQRGAEFGRAGVCIRKAGGLGRSGIICYY